ncbi:MAG: IMP cyclohydrolase [Candidatus Aminicenantes bacterium]
MREGLKYLAQSVYPGRLIIIGRDRTGGNIITAYAITGRSSSSQARRLVRKKESVWTEPTQKNLIQEQKRELLFYPALFLSPGLTVGNGRHNLDVKSRLSRSQNQSPSEIMSRALSRWDYEPDPPIFTPRISGCVVPSLRAALSLIKRGEDGSTLRNTFEFPLVAGMGKALFTYKGDNREPLEPFSGEPLDLELNENNSRYTAEALYQALCPAEGGKDFRVAAACVFSSISERKSHDVFIINRYERRGEKHG